MTTVWVLCIFFAFLAVLAAGVRWALRFVRDVAGACTRRPGR